MEMEELEGPPRRRASFDRDWTKGSIIGNLLSLGLPMVVTSFIGLIGGPTIDMIWVGRLGAAAIAGMGVAGIIVQVMQAAKMGLTTGLRALVARAVGAQNFAEANHVLQQYIVITALFSIAMLAIGITLADDMLRLLGLAPDVVARGAPYLRIQFAAAVFMSVGMMTTTAMQASGDAINPMKISIVGRAVDTVLTPFLVFGWWLFPRLEVTGVAVVNTLAYALTAALGLWFLFSGRTRLRATLRNFRFDGKIIWRVVKVGIPASVTGVERSFANLVVTWILAPFGTRALAAHSLMQRVDQFIQMPGMGFGRASGVLVGQNLGAAQPERAARTGWLAAGLFTAIMVTVAVVIWFWAEYLVRIFNSEPELVRITATFLRIQIASYMAFGLALVLSESLNGVGDTVATMVVTLISMWAVQVPLAYFLPRITNLGVYGVVCGIASGTVIRGLIYAIYFKLGRWKRKRV